MSSCISAIGTANPQYRTNQREIYHFMVNAFGLDNNNAVRLKQIYDNSGIEYRYSVLSDFDRLADPREAFFNDSADSGSFPGTGARMEIYRDKAKDIAAAAAQDCLKNLRKNISAEITHLITVSCTGIYAPGIDIELVELLGLNRAVERTCINFMGCYGALNALKTADYICRADEKSKVLIICVELCTLHFQKENTLENWVANSLFSDGAAATLVENTSNASEGSEKLILDTFYSEFLPAGRNEMGWYVGDTGFEMKLTSKVSKLISKHIPALTESLLQKASLQFDEVTAFAIHPGGRKILESAEEALRISKSENKHGYEILRDYGNMSSASILFVLKNLLNDANADLKNVLGFAFGPGLTVESMILKRSPNA